jgi:hypothetical protein
MKACDSIKTRNVFHVKHLREGKVLEEFYCFNLVTTVGKNHILDVALNQGTQVANWYMGLVDNASFSAFAAADTMGSHAGWVESSDYGEATRPEWTVGNASAGSSTNASVIVFTINATKTIKGIFLTSNNTKGGTTGTLLSEVAFASNLSVISGDVIQVTYTFSLT